MRKSITGGKIGAFDQSYESVVSNKIFNIISSEFEITGNKYEIFEKHISYIKTYKSKIENENDSHFDDCRHRNQKVRDRFVNDKLSELPISIAIKNLDLNDLLMAFNSTSLYPRAMVDGDYP